MDEAAAAGGGVLHEVPSPGRFALFAEAAEEAAAPAAGGGRVAIDASDALVPASPSPPSRLPAVDGCAAPERAREGIGGDWQPSALSTAFVFEMPSSTLL